MLNLQYFWDIHRDVQQAIRYADLELKDVQAWIQILDSSVSEAMDMDVTGKEDWQEGIEQIPGTSTFNGQVQDRPVRKTKKETSGRKKSRTSHEPLSKGRVPLMSN